MKKLFFSFWIFLIITKVHSQCAGTGSINFQRWNNISGGTISDLTSNINYPNIPTSIGVQTSFEMPINQANNFGIKMYGYICPPATGNYVFWIAADNSGELWLSTSANIAEKVRVAYNTSSVASREWNRYTTQKSVAIALIAGQKYYVEALMKESTGKDNLAIGWAKPGQSTAFPSEVVPGSSLSVSNIADTQAPSPPTNLTASNITTMSFTLSWLASSDNVAVTGYDVYKDGEKINTSIIATTSFDVTGLSSNTTYSMAVKAKDAAGNESASNALPVTTNDIPDTEAPSAPTNLNATTITTGSFTLNWNASTDNVAVTGYDVYKDGEKINTSIITTTSFDVTGLSPNTIYSMTVKARDAAGNQSSSNPFPVMTQASIPSSPILTLPLSSARTISNQTNVVIENLRFEDINGTALNIFSCNTVTIRNCFFNKATEEAINIENSSNVIIEYCLFNGVTTGVYALKTQNIKVRNNQFVNVRMRDNGGRGQFVQFNEVTGAGNIIENNRGENFAGESNPEDLISIFISSGTPSSPINVRNNIFRGGGPSTSGSGIMTGDHGGDNTIVENNTLLDPGQTGIAVAGGKNISILNNKIYARQQPFTNNPLYVWGQTGSCSNITVRGNRINWTDKNGLPNNGWNAGNCSKTIFEPPTTITLAEMNVPDHLIDMVTPSELLVIRGSQFITWASRHKQTE